MIGQKIRTRYLPKEIGLLKARFLRWRQAWEDEMIKDGVIGLITGHYEAVSEFCQSINSQRRCFGVMCTLDE